MKEVKIKLPDHVVERKKALEEELAARGCLSRLSYRRLIETALRVLEEFVRTEP